MKDGHARGSLTGTIELEPEARNFATSSKEQGLNTTSNTTTTQDVRMEREPETFSADRESQHEPSAVVAHALEKWNEPSANISRLFATFWAFVVMGANDAAYGVSPIFMIPVLIVLANN